MTITNMYNLIAKANGYGTLDVGGGECVPVYINDIDCISHGRCQNEIRLNCSVLNSAEGCKKPRSSLGIKNVIFNDPATIVFWTDGTKTVVKAYADKFDPEKGLAMAIAKKFLGNQGNYYNEFRKWLPKEEEVELSYPSLDVGALFPINIMRDIVEKTIADNEKHTRTMFYRYGWLG